MTFHIYWLGKLPFGEGNTTEMIRAWRKPVSFYVREGPGFVLHTEVGSYAKSGYYIKAGSETESGPCTESESYTVAGSY